MKTKIVLDIEGNNLMPWITNFWCAVAIDVATQKKTEFVFDLSSENPYEEFFKFCSEYDYLLAHNGLGFDYPAMEKFGYVRPEEQVYIDTLVMSRLLNPDRPFVQGTRGPHSVEAWGKRLGRWKPEHEDWSQYTPEMLHRCSEDTEIQYMMYQVLLQEAGIHDKNADIFETKSYVGTDTDWSLAFREEHASALIMEEQPSNGVFFKKEKAEGYTEVLTEIIDGIEEKILQRTPKTPKMKGAEVSKPFKKNGDHTKAVCDWMDGDQDQVAGPFSRIEWKELNLGSFVQLKEWLYTLGWEPDEWNFKKDKQGKLVKDLEGNLIKTSPKITESSLESIDGELGPMLALRSKSSHRRSQIQGWIDNTRDDGRVRAEANPQGTNTGRMKHRIVANVPKPNVDKETHELVWYPDKQKVFFGTEMRSLFSCPDDRVLIGRDASGLELRCFAHYIDDPDYTDIILNGDIHTYNQEAAGLDNRDQAKTFIYAFLYGAGDAKIGEIVAPNETKEMKQKIGKQLKEQFLAANPKLDQLIKNVKKASGRGWLRGIDGRRLMMRSNDGRIAKNKALNTLLQGAGAIIMTRARVWLYEEANKRGFTPDAIKVLDYHDEETWEISPEPAEEFRELMIESVVRSGTFFNFRCPLDADARIGKSWAEIH